MPVPLHRGRDGRDDIDWDTKIAMLEAKSKSKPYLPPLIVDTEEGTKAESKFESKFESNCKPTPLLKIKARNKGQYKDPPPRRRYRMIRAFRRRQDSKLKNLIDLTQYQDVIPAPTTTVIENNDVFYDTPSSFPDWLPTCDKDPVQFDRPSPSSSSKKTKQ